MNHRQQIIVEFTAQFTSVKPNRDAIPRWNGESNKYFIIVVDEAWLTIMLELIPIRLRFLSTSNNCEKESTTYTHKRRSKPMQVKIDEIWFLCSIKYRNIITEIGKCYWHQNKHRWIDSAVSVHMRIVNAINRGCKWNTNALEWWDRTSERCEYRLESLRLAFSFICCWFLLVSLPIDLV